LASGSGIALELLQIIRNLIPLRFGFHKYVFGDFNANVIIQQAGRNPEACFLVAIRNGASTLATELVAVAFAIPLKSPDAVCATGPPETISRHCKCGIEFGAGYFSAD
jgi:hypothetical protein